MKDRRSKIIFVGHSAGYLESLRNLLGELGGVESSRSFREALDKLAGDSFDLAVVEVGRNVSAALDFCSTLQGVCPSTPVLFVASTQREGLGVDFDRGSSELVVEFLTRGADDLFHWPISHAALVARARSLIRRCTWL